MVTYREFIQEKEDWQKLKSAADRLCRDIKSGKIQSPAQLEEATGGIRRLCQELFPDKIELFEMIYPGRFKRIWEQFGPEKG